MAVSPEELIAPVGPVEPDFFPGEHENDESALIERLSSYVGQAEDKVVQYSISDAAIEDSAVRAYALHLAFRGAYMKSIARPAEDDLQTEVLGRMVFTEDQRIALKSEAEKYLNEYELIIAGQGATSTAQTGLPSYQSKNEFDW